MEPSKSPYTRDYDQPAAGEDGQVKTEVVNDIPVQRQAGGANPITSAPATQAAAVQENDRDLDKVLTDVNREVGKQSAEPAKDQKKLPLPAKKPGAKPAKKPGGQKPVLAITVAVISGLALMAAAYLAFKGNK